MHGHVAPPARAASVTPIGLLLLPPLAAAVLLHAADDDKVKKAEKRWGDVKRLVN